MKVAYFERENARLVKQLREAESTASELADELDSAKRTADSATSMVWFRRGVQGVDPHARGSVCPSDAMIRAVPSHIPAAFF